MPKSKFYTKEKMRKFEDLPNVGREVARDLRLLGLKTPEDLKKKTGIGLYKALNKKTGVRQDPCMLDTFMAMVDYVNGAPSNPWFKYTAIRKKLFPDI